MILCKDCKWWNEEVPINVHTLMPMPDSQRACNHIKIGGTDRDGAGVDAGYGGIETGPDFGCIHGEKTP